MSAIGRGRSWRTAPGRILAGSLAVLLWSGCTGQIGKTGAPGPGGAGATGLPQGSGGGGGSVVPTGGVGGGTTPPLDCTLANLEASPVRRLTRREYNTVVNHLLGDTTKPADQFVSE